MKNRVPVLCASPVIVGLLAAVVACDARPKTATEPVAARSHSGAALAVLDLSKGVPEKETPSILDVSHRGTFDELVRVIDGLSRDPNTGGVFVRFGGTSFGIARAMEIGEGLEVLRKANKPVICHAEELTNSTFYAAARGCSKIILSPAGELETIGLAAQLIYAHKLLAEELRLSVDILQVGKFKGAEEPLTRDGPSDEARASLQGVLVDLRARWREGIAAGRGHDEAADAVEDGPYSAGRAKEVGLIDEIAYLDEAREEARKEAGALHDDVRFGGGNDESGAADEIGDMVRLLAGEKGGGAPVALVRATGSISMASSGGMFGGSSGITAKELERTLARLEKDDDVRAVVLRIDSPGGSALASDLIWHRLMKLREKKPLVVSVGDMAASGGYYMACTGTVIFAEPTSIVGSIGVVGGKVAAEHTLEMIGVHAETFAANTKNPNAAARAAYLSPLIAWDDDTRTRVFQTMTSIYDLFLARIAEGRKTTADKIAPNAEGRIFSGTEGKARGLVDELGGLGAAIARARVLANLPADARVEAIAPSRNVLESLGAAGSSDSDGEESASATAPLGREVPRLVELVVQAAPDVGPFLQSLLPLASGEHALTAVPFALVVR